MRKLTQDEFLVKVADRLSGPWDLSRFVYSGTSVKGVAVCPDHGEFQVTPNALMNGIGCNECAKVSRGKKRRLTQEEFLARAQSIHGSRYDYSEASYQGQNKKVIIKCKEHGPFSQTPDSHLGGRGCPECGRKAIGDNSRLSHDEFLQRLLELNTGYGLDEVRYESMSKHITLVCKEHGRFSAQAGNVLYRKSGCPKCAVESNGKRSRKSFESYVNRARAVHGERFEYLGVEYENAQAYLRVYCREHGEFRQSAQDHLRGIGCQKCSKPMFDHGSFIAIANQVHGAVYDYSLSEYRYAIEPVTILCKRHGKFEQTPSSHVNGQGCPKCANVGPSEAQLEIYEFLSGHINVELEYALDGTRKRLDLFIPRLNLAVEYHGLIWHSTKFKEDPREDYKKHKLAESLGIRVIHIYEDEWKLRRSVVERTLLSAIGKLPRVFARSTKLVELSTSEADTFYEVNHLQGKCMAEVAYGLRHGGELVACMSFGIARSNRRNTDKEVWELERYAATKTIVGGAGKLLSAFIKSGRAREIVSYSDSRAFSGNMYKALGFDLVDESAPDYKYTNGNYRFGRQHKSKYQRKNLPSILTMFDPEKSEAENCRDNGLYQIFDCGKRKWILKL